MEPILVLGLLAILTVLSFVVFRPKKKPSLGPSYWNNQSMSSNELAKMFAFQNDVDRLIEMLRLSSSIVPAASDYRASAAATGIPVLYQRYIVPWEQTELVIDSLIIALDDAPDEATHALSALSVGKHLGTMEEKVVTKLIEKLSKPDHVLPVKTKVKICDALGYIGSYLAIEPLCTIAESSPSAELTKAASHSLSRLGVNNQNGNQKTAEA